VVEVWKREEAILSSLSRWSEEGERDELHRQRDLATLPDLLSKILSLPMLVQTRIKQCTLVRQSYKLSR
jgi:hypothetical protein